MAAKLTILTHKIAIQLHVVADNCTICSSRSRRPVRKLLDTPSCVCVCVCAARARARACIYIYIFILVLWNTVTNLRVPQSGEFLD
jgi:hypothetical protein